MTQVDNHYSNAKLAAIYDVGNGWSIDRQFYLELAGTSPIRVLDLGCGTGLICDAYAARGHEVTGADPAPSMLDVARRKPNGAKIEWVLSDAQSFRSEKRFDLIIMTGHAFQVLLDEADLRRAFLAMRTHLAPEGRIVFESRNPVIDWEERWNESDVLTLPEGEVRVDRKVGSIVDGRIRFETFYRFPTETLSSKSELRFWTRQEIESLLAENGLEVAAFYGDWSQGVFSPANSEEMIFEVRAKRA